MKPLLEKAIEIAKLAEPIARANGWHVAITGSVLYGMVDHDPEDIDLLFYWHKNQPKTSSESLTKLMPFLSDIQDLRKYPESERGVLTGFLSCGVKVDCIFINGLSPE